MINSIYIVTGFEGVCVFHGVRVVCFDESNLVTIFRTSVVFAILRVVSFVW